ncbi:MAG: aconitase X catalytic domain-containing protein [Clostridia bacterium]|nr:aconitase X catalytic domain-containing protein [Clostridia bacterium]
MELSPEQLAILQGNQGPVKAMMMHQLVQLGQAMEAKRLVPISNAHAILTGGGKLLSMLPEDAAAKQALQMDMVAGTRVAVKTTVQSGTVDLEQIDYLGIPEEAATVERKLLHEGSQSGFEVTWTCTPYLVGNVPSQGEVLAWTESSAVLYANSMLGARTNRNGISAIAAAVTGWVPEYGMLLDGCRKAQILVEVTVPLVDEMHWGALGYFTGDRAGLKVPVFTGLPSPTLEQVKQLCAALATSGGMSMFHIVGVTPEAPDLEAALGNHEPLAQYTFGSQELQETIDRMRQVSGKDIDHAVLGCPHATLYEVERAARLLRGKRLPSGVKVWIWTPFALKEVACRLGYVDAIEGAGGKVLSDSCPLAGLFSGGTRMVTNSFKMAHYSRAMLGNEVYIADWRSCLEAALEGRLP